jgi:hypothetical protein
VVAQFFAEVAPRVYGAWGEVSVPCLNYVLSDDYGRLCHGEQWQSVERKQAGAKFLMTIVTGSSNIMESY